MKNNYIISTLLFAIMGFYGCNTGTKTETTEASSATPKEEVTDTSTASQLSVEDIDKVRADVEALQIQSTEVSTTALREKIKQKWSKIHFYAQDGVLMKVKTYPHSQVSKRTEEFYANKDGLLLVVVEDNGEGQKGKPKTELDKMYYYSNGKLIKEISKGNEAEFSVRESDAEELLSEFNEYKEIFNSSKK